ncbi:MAG: hypothetical protein PHD83_03820 [Caldisericia bacterium]|nr:hypothetical protein [Caldisericia bacterium]
MLIKRKKQSSGLLFFFGAILFFLTLLLPAFRTFPVEKVFEDQAFAESTIQIISNLPFQERRKLLYSHYPSLHENLLLMALADKKLTRTEIKLMRLTSDNYPTFEITKEQAEWLLRIQSIPDMTIFFQESIPLECITEISIAEDMFMNHEIKVFQESEKSIPILMYHQIHETNFWITPTTFRKHLEEMYRSGFCLISLSDFFKGDFSSIPDGRKPILITFDDAFESQFTMTKDGKPADNCAVGIMEAFSREHPDFNCTAAFFPYLSIIPFGQVNQEELWLKKFKYLWDRGYDIGCHSYYHTFFEKISEKAIKEELDFFYNHLSYYFPDDYQKSFFIAYPYGSLPKNKQYIKYYEYKGNQMVGGFSAWGGLSPQIHHGDRFYIPRIQADADTLNEIDTWVSYTVESKTFILPKFYENRPQLVNLWVRKNNPESIGRYFYQYKVFD